jgi:hypothetical protein
MMSTLHLILHTYTFGLLMTRYKFYSANQAGVINVISSPRNSPVNFRTEHVLAVENAVQFHLDVTGNNRKHGSELIANKTPPP